jgi:putative hydrolase of the HAD superfamily
VFIFDIGNVLIDFDLQRLQRSIVDKSGTSLLRIQSHWEGDDFLAVETGRLSCSDYFRRFRRSTGLRWTYEEWIKAWMDVYSPNRSGQRLFAGLKRKNYHVCTLSNLAQYNKIAIERKFPGFFEQASKNFLSYQMHLHKPDKRIYEAVCKSLHVKPHQCFVLDDCDKNVAAAQEVGMRGYVFSTRNPRAIAARIRKVLKTDFCRRRRSGD